MSFASENGAGFAGLETQDGWAESDSGGAPLATMRIAIPHTINAGMAHVIGTDSPSEGNHES